MSDAYRVKPSEIRALSPSARSSLAAWIARVGDMEGDGDAAIPKPQPFATTREDRDLPDERRQIVIRWEGGEYRSRVLPALDATAWAQPSEMRKEERATARVEAFVSTLTRPPKAAKGGCASRKATKAAPVVQPVAPAPVPVPDRLVPRPIVRLARPAHMRRAVVVVKAAPPAVEPVQIVTTIASAPPAAPAPVDLLALFWQTCSEGRA